MAIEQIPVEILAIIFELVVHSSSITDDLKSASNVNLSHINSLFRAVVIDTPALWASVSNKQSPEMLHLCVERSKQSNLRVALLLVDFGTDSYIDFLEAVIPHSSRWEEFYFESGRSLTDYWPVIHALPKHCHGLQLPNLSTLTLLYPDPTFYETDWDYIPAPDESHDYVSNAHNPRNHFYSSWETPKLRYLMTRNIVPYHTESAELTSCEVTIQSSCWSSWSIKPLFTMYPHWAKLRSLTIESRADTLYAEGPFPMPTIVLPLLENISLSFPTEERVQYRHWLLDILDFPNVVDIYVGYMAILERFSPDQIQNAMNHVQVLLREKTEYTRLERFKFVITSPDAVVFTSVFERKVDIPNVRIRFAAVINNKAGSRIMYSPDSPGIEGIACTRALSDVIRKQAGWKGLSEMTIVNGSEDKAERVRAAFPGWRIHHLSRLEEPEYVAEYKFIDDDEIPLLPWE